MAQKLDQSWRTQYYLLNYYVDHEQWAEAVKVGRNAYKRYPDNYYIGLKYAMGSLLRVGQYMASLNCLKKLQVLLMRDRILDVIFIAGLVCIKL